MSCACNGSCGGCATSLAVLLQGYSGDELSGGFAGVEDSLWPPTGDLDTATESLALSVSELGHDVIADNTGSGDDVQTWLRAWNAFVRDFTQWKGAGYYWNPSRRDALVDYRRRFNDLLARYHELPGAITTGAEAVKGDTPGASPLAQAESLVTKVVGGALVLGGLYAGWQILGPIMALKVRRYAVSNPRRRRRRVRR